MDLLFVAGKLPEKEYFAWLRDHVEEASFAIGGDEELWALLEVAPEDRAAAGGAVAG